MVLALRSAARSDIGLVRTGDGKLLTLDDGGTLRLLAADGAAVLIMSRRQDALQKVKDAILKDIPDAQIDFHAGGQDDRGRFPGHLPPGSVRRRRKRPWRSGAGRARVR